MNDDELLPQNAMLVLIEAIGLLDNIPPKEGVKCVANRLKESPSSKVPAEFTERLLQIIVDYSVFEFNGKTYQHRLGTTMGTKPAPSYANRFMAEIIDKKFFFNIRKYIENGRIPLWFLKRILDDIFLKLVGSIMQLHVFFNEIQPSALKYKVYQSSACLCPHIEAILYLDISCHIKENPHIKTSTV